MKISKNYKILGNLMSIFLFTSVVQAQTFSLTGKLTDSVSANGLAGATLNVGGLVSITDANGDFTINNVPSGTYSISGSLDHYTIVPKDVVLNANKMGVELFATGDSKTLAVIPLKARKDTTMLCLDGCLREGEDAWNKSRESAPDLGIHDGNYCVYTAVTMLNRFYGGSITRDECAYEAHHQPTPDRELGHDDGAVFLGATASLRNALNYPPTMEYLDHEPSDSEYKAFIDDNRPMYWSCQWVGTNVGHAMVVAGYRYVDKKFEIQFLNTNNNGKVEWIVRHPSGGVWDKTIVPPLNSVGKQTDPLVSKDSDNDGVSDFDEVVRWNSDSYLGEKLDLKENDVDTDKDGLPDGKDIEGWLFRGTNDPIGKGKFDDDGDTLRGEMDPDSDNGGVRDGDEDANHDANKTADETDPYSPIKPNADDIPKVKITLTPIIQAEQKVFVTGNVTATFVFYRKDGATTLPIFDKDAGPLTVNFTLNGGASVAVTLIPADAVPTMTWTGNFTIEPTAPIGKAVFSVKNGATDVEIIAGKDFYIDARSGLAGSIKQ